MGTHIAFLTTNRSPALLLSLVLWLLQATAYGQVDTTQRPARQLIRYQQAALPEKLFLHLDRPLYLSGETMWFKVYAADGTYVQPLPLSTVAYVEVLNGKNQAVMQAKIPLKKATGNGSFLLPTSLASGTYTVRAYTSWMQNFGPETYFHSPVTIVNTSVASGAAPSTDSLAYDVQFFPEGGNLVQGLSSKVAFKATAKTSTGIAAEGKLVNRSGAVVATFKTLRFGMGSFSFTPEAGNTYTAIVTLPKGRIVKRKLPQAFEQGYVMRLQATSADKLTLSVSSTSQQPETIFLLGHSRQRVAVAAQAHLLDGRAVFTVDRSQLLEGVSHFTLFNAAQKPLCERLYFQAPKSTLLITAQADKNSYNSREKVTVRVATMGQEAQSLGTELSMAVYRLDSLTASPTPDIGSYLWLTSELKGTVEHPEYYLTASTQDVAEAADNLMLTQGWSRFRWEHVLANAPVVFPYSPELYGPLVRGRITQPGTNRPKAGVMTYLASPSRSIRLQNAVSDAAGMVQFEMNDIYGSRALMVQTDPIQDSTCQIDILSSFSTQFATPAVVPFTPLPRFRAEFTNRHFQNQVQAAYATKASARYILPSTDTTSFYGKAHETYLLDKYTRFKVLEEVMREYVPGVLVRLRKDGYHFMVVDRINKTIFSTNPMVLLDGVPVFDVNKMMAMDPLKIQKLEVMASRYFHGSAVYSGLVSFTTYKGDLEDFQLDPRVLVQQYEGLQGQREFYSPRYDTPQARRSRLPDLRNLLYWNPSVTTTGSTPQPLEFYTGDQAGRYLVVIQGLAGTGLAGSTSFTFDVKQPL